MTTDTADPSTTETDEPQLAFEAMGRKLAGLTAAVEGFAARQQELHARDYGPDLIRIHERWEKAREAFGKLMKYPALQLTPDEFASRVEKASAQARERDHRAWIDAHQALGMSIQSLNDVVASAHSAETQKAWIAGAAAAALVVGFVFGTIVPTRVAQFAPESWHWPEQDAASILQRDGWTAGERLLQVYDPKRWDSYAKGVRIAADNAEAVSGCLNRAAKANKLVYCIVRIGGPSGP